MKKASGLFGKMMHVSSMPVLLLGIVLTWFCYVRFCDTMYAEDAVGMKNIANAVIMAYDIAYPGDYELVGNTVKDLDKGGQCITNDYSIIDRISEECDMDISLLYMDMRVHTTIQTDSGVRLAGIYTNKDTANQVLNLKQDAFYKDIKIGDDSYLVFYTPIYNSDGTVTGMVEVARKTELVKASVWHAVWPILVIDIVATIIAAVFSMQFTNQIIATLKKIQKFMNRVADGNLQTDLDIDVLKRQDELGEIGRHSTKMQRSLREFIETDPLTGLNNRRYADYMLGKVRDRFVESGQRYAVAIGDIDFFKKVNDTYGHLAGDEVLKSVSALLKKAMSGKGFIARWGGEEFLLVFDKYTVENAEHSLNEMLNEIRKMEVHFEDMTIQVTMTFGVTAGTEEETEDMIDAADERLYYGKMNGRNQVVASSN